MGVYKRPDVPDYWMSLQVHGQRVRMTTGTSDFRLTQEIFSAWRVELARERWLGPAPPGLDYTIAQLIDRYLSIVSPQKSPHSQRHDQRVLARLTTLWGNQLVTELNSQVVEAYMAGRLKRVSLATVSKELGTLRAAYRCAHRGGWTSHDPFHGVKLNQQGQERSRWLTDEEEPVLLSACPSWLADLVVVRWIQAFVEATWCCYVTPRSTTIARLS